MSERWVRLHGVALYWYVYTQHKRKQSLAVLCVNTVQFILCLKDDTQGCVCVVCDSVKQTLSTVLDICCASILPFCMFVEPVVCVVYASHFACLPVCHAALGVSEQGSIVSELVVSQNKLTFGRQIGDRQQPTGQ